MCYHNISKVKLLHCVVNKEQNKHHCSIQSCTTNYSLLQISAYVSDWEQNLNPKTNSNYHNTITETVFPNNLHICGQYQEGDYLNCHLVTSGAESLHEA